MTAYLWREILTRRSLTNIIEHYARLTEVKDKKSGKVKVTLFFPLYHDLRVVRRLLHAVQTSGVGNAHHLHVWELDEHHRALEAHVVMTSAVTDHSELRQRIKQVLKERFNIGHSTLELEGSDGDQQCSDQGLLHSH